MRRIREERGAVAVIVALMVTALFGLTALVVDLGLARTNVRRAQYAADAAALAAALSYVKTNSASSAQAAAYQYLASNYAMSSADWSSCLAATPSCLTIGNTTVTVTLPARNSPVSFGRIFGATGIGVSATGIASWGSSLPGDCLLCVLGDATINSGDFEGDHRGIATVTDGNVKVDGTLDIEPGAFPGSLTVTRGNVYYQTLGGLPPTVSPSPGYTWATLSGPFGDPYAGIPDPWSQPLSTSIRTALPATASPYAKLISSPAPETCSPRSGQSVTWITTEDASNCAGFAPGMYFVVPGQRYLGFSSPITVDPTNHAQLVLHGGGANVMLYLTCSTGTSSTGVPHPCGSGMPQAYLRSATGSITLSGLTSSAPAGLSRYQGLAVMIDPNDTANGNTGQILGDSSGTFTINGSVYAPGSPVSANDRAVVNGQVVVGMNFTVGMGSGCTPTSHCIDIAKPSAQYAVSGGSTVPVHIASTP